MSFEGVVLSTVAKSVPAMATNSSTLAAAESLSTVCQDWDWIVKVVLLVAIPFLAGAFLIYVLDHENKSYMGVLWVVSGIVAASPCFFSEDAVDALCLALDDSIGRSLDSIKFVFSMVTPLLVLPIGVFLARSAAMTKIAMPPGSTSLSLSTFVRCVLCCCMCHPNAHPARALFP